MYVDPGWYAAFFIPDSLGEVYDLVNNQDLGWIGLGFNDPVNTIKVMLSESIYLTTLFLGR